MKTRRKRRSRTQHTGVSLKRRSNGSWIARWCDPLGGGHLQQSLDKLGLTTAEARTAWAIQKADQIAEQKAAIANGTAVVGPVEVAAAIKAFLEAKEAETRATTLDGYRPHLNALQAWAQRAGIRLVQDFTGPRIAAFRDHAVSTKATSPVRGGKRGAKSAGGKRAATATINKRLTIAKAFLGWARKRGYMPAIPSSDIIKDNLEPLETSREAIDFLKPKQLRALLEACQRHDAARFTMTREEHDGARPVGTTPRYVPVAPFVLLLLGTGMRFGEAIGLEWREVDLDAGRIDLPASRVKTKTARTITLAESPTVLALLNAMKLQAGGAAKVFPELTRDYLESARTRLVSTFGAPAGWSWQWLRRSAAALLTNAPSIYNAASAFRSAARCGHSVTLAQKSYLGLLDDIPKEAETLEAAAGIEDVANGIVATVRGDDGAATKVAQ